MSKAEIQSARAVENADGTYGKHHLNIVNPSGSLQVLLAGSHDSGGYQAIVDSTGKLMVNTEMTISGIVIDNIAVGQDIYGAEQKMIVDTDGRSMTPGTPRWMGVAGYDDAGDTLQAMHLDASGNQQVIVLHSAPIVASIEGDGRRAKVSTGGRLMVDTELTVSGINIDNVAVGEDILGVERKFIVDIDGRDLSVGTARWAGMAGYDTANTTHKPLHVDASGNLQVDVLHMPHGINVRDLDPSRDGVRVYGDYDNTNKQVQVDASGNLGVAGFENGSETLVPVHVDASGNLQVDILHSAPLTVRLVGDGREANVTTGGRLMVDTELTVSGIYIDNVAVGEDILGVERKFIVDIDGRDLSAGTARWAGVAGYDYGNTTHKPLHVDASGNLQVDILNSDPLDPDEDGVLIYGADGLTNRKVHVDASGNLQVDVLHTAPISVDLDADDDSISIFGTDGTLNRQVHVDASGNLQVDVLNSDPLDPDEDGVLIYGADGLTNRKVHIDSSGNLQVDILHSPPISVDLDADTDSVSVYGNDGVNNTQMHVDASGNLQVDILHSAPISVDLSADGGDSVIIHGYDRRLDQNRAVNVDISGNVFNKRLSTAHEVINEDRAYHKRYYEWDGSNNVTYMGETTNVVAISGTADCEITRYWYYGGTNNIRTEQKLTGAWSNRTSLSWSEA